METEIVYLGYDNTIDLLLLKDDNDGNGMCAVNLSGVTKMTLTFDNTVIVSTNLDTDPIRWDKEGYQKGEIRLFLGDQTIKAKDYNAKLVVYDAVYDDGLVWGFVAITVKGN